MDVAEDHYGVLGLTRYATIGDIRRAYRAMALQLHPDKNPSGAATAQFKKVSSAYSTLSDTVQRGRYDQLLFEQHCARQQSSAQPYPPQRPHTAGPSRSTMMYSFGDTKDKIRKDRENAAANPRNVRVSAYGLSAEEFNLGGVTWDFGQSAQHGRFTADYSTNNGAAQPPPPPPRNRKSEVPAKVTPDMVNSVLSSLKEHRNDKPRTATTEAAAAPNPCQTESPEDDRCDAYEEASSHAHHPREVWGSTSSLQYTTERRSPRVAEEKRPIPRPTGVESPQEEPLRQRPASANIKFRSVLHNNTAPSWFSTFVASSNTNHKVHQETAAPSEKPPAATHKLSAAEPTVTEKPRSAAEKPPAAAEKTPPAFTAAAPPPSTSTLSNNSMNSFSSDLALAARQAVSVPDDETIAGMTLEALNRLVACLQHKERIARQAALLLKLAPSSTNNKAATQ